jgi:hypothetical protein
MNRNTDFYEFAAESAEGDFLGARLNCDKDTLRLEMSDEKSQRVLIFDVDKAEVSRLIDALADVRDRMEES